MLEGAYCVQYLNVSSPRASYLGGWGGGGGVHIINSQLFINILYIYENSKKIIGKLEGTSNSLRNIYKRHEQQLNCWLFHNSNTISQSNTSQVVCELDRISTRRLYHVVAICIVNVFLFVTSLFGNFAILIAVWKTSSLHSPANMLLSSLALTDFAVGLITIHLLFITYVISAFSSVHWLPLDILTSF